MVQTWKLSAQKQKQKLQGDDFHVTSKIQVAKLKNPQFTQSSVCKIDHKNRFQLNKVRSVDCG